MQAESEFATRVHTIRLERKREYYAMLRSYNVLLDGREVGNVRNGQVLGFPVTSGPHNLRIKCDWTYSNTVEFDGAEPDIHFVCGSNMNTLPKLFLTLLYTTIWRHKAMWIRRAEEPAE